MMDLLTPEAFSKAVRARRLQMGLTQRELALAAGLGRIAVLRLENEPHKVQLQTALRVARMLQLDLAISPAPVALPTVAAYEPVTFEGVEA
ncbi:MAG: helix-turn-helix transcriptional regulator [Neomegalonema sp.]|nr:helix-turn-helix transcriptional regulator [Neomegalonema sp.]